MKTAALAVVAVLLLITTPAFAQLGGSGASTGSAGGPHASGAGATRREIPAAIRDVRDRPFGSMATGSIMGSTGTYGALGTGGSIASGTGHGSGIGYDSGFAKDLGNTGYRFSPNFSPTNPPPLPK
ncbi:MAG TPA: hypothetical protein VIE36_16290 [Methylomirabilota bacterium]|jgi:hypothetical protein